jgi:hypothetical protein
VQVPCMLVASNVLLYSTATKHESRVTDLIMNGCA